ncbi:uncharacterized protein LOC113300520 [Papaver somniferum]|uniref:uncharacterized protein LOC113300520 n=1 Tax=Papaver somniferum TaxID=3469 RepID=UPI000E6FF460|nr:uncharacterized protein LOC113300520 [Papaver somniferum]
MIKLKRKWMKSRREDDSRFSIPTQDDSLPIETHQQEELVRSFEQKQTQQSRLWRGVFSTLLIGYVVFMVFSIYQQASFPWELRYHGYFMGEIDSRMVIAADWIAVLACLMAVKGLFHNSISNRQWLIYSCFTGLLVAAFWLYHMLSLSKFHWDIIWLPLGPLSGAGLSLYIDHLLNESSEEIRKLRASMYSYKAA